MQEKPGQFLVDDFYLWDYNSSATRWLSLGSNQYLISIMLLLVYSFIIKIPSKSNPIPIKIPSLELSTLKAKTTLRTGHGTTDWFQIRKGVLQSCILSPCLFNLHAEYVMRNTGLGMKHKLESRLPGEISVTSDMQMKAPLWQKVKKN